MKWWSFVEMFVEISYQKLRVVNYLGLNITARVSSDIEVLLQCQPH